jgi:hypothetical protein
MIVGIPTFPFTGDQNSELFLNVVHLVNASVNYTSVAAQDS